MGKHKESTRRKKTHRVSNSSGGGTSGDNPTEGKKTMPDDHSEVRENRLENEVTFESEHHEKHEHHHDQNHHRRSSSNRNGYSDRKNQHRHHKSKRHRRHHSGGHSIKDRMRRYVYSAISSTFLFVMFREMGWIDQMHSIMQSRASTLLRRKSGGGKTQVLGGAGTENLAAAAANMAGTSMTIKDTVSAQDVPQNTLAQAPNTYISRAEMMEHAKHEDETIVAGSRPTIYTFFEWIPPRNRGTQMSDLADKSLITEWKAAWKAAGWNPRILTLEDAKKHPKYEDYAPKLNKIPMLGVDGLGGNVIYNQLCFFRWLAMAQVGGGFMSDYDVFPVSRAPKSLDPPYSGNFTVYCKIKRSETAGIPCLMSGNSDEWIRMAYALLDNGIKNAETESMWSDMLALIDMRNDGAYQITDAVLEGQDVLLKHGWTPDDCSITRHKKAVHFSHEALRLGYINPGETAEDRPDIVRKFLERWHQACGAEEEAMA